MKTVRTLKTTQKLISMILILLLIFYIIPSTVYAEVVGAFSFDEEAEKVTEENAKVGETVTITDDEMPVYKYDGKAFEDEELREENVKHFRLEDGSYVAAQYQHPVHYEDENGKMQDIDNALSSVGSDYANPNARIKFSKKITGNSRIFALHDGNMKINMSLVGAKKGTVGQVFNNSEAEAETKLQKLMSLEKISSRIIYEDILDGVDLEYIATGLNVKENIIVKERKESYSYSFELSLNNLTAVLTGNGDISLCGEDGEEKYNIPAPIVYDSANAYADKGMASYTLEDLGNKKYIMTVSVSSEWMNSQDRVYPVTVDPTVRVFANSVCDTTIDSNDVFSSYASDDTLCVSNTKTAFVNYGIDGLYDYNYISNVYIALKPKEGNNTFVSAHLIYTYWDEYLTWHSYQNNYEGQYEGRVLDYQDITPKFEGVYGEEGFVYWDVTDAVYDWETDMSPYLGIAFEHIIGGEVKFYSSESTYSYSHPCTLVKYRNMSGTEEHWETDSHNVGIAGNGEINLANGNLTFSIPTLSTTDSLMQYTVKLIYNLTDAGDQYKYANPAYTTSFTPYGFKLNLMETVVKKPYSNYYGNTSYYYLYTDADGTAHAFQTLDGPSGIEYDEYIDESGLGRKIEINDDNTILTITNRDKEVRTFSKMNTTSSNSISESWYLTSISDKNGNKICFSFDYDLRPTKVSMKPNGSEIIDYLNLFYNYDGNLYAISNFVSGEAVIFRYSEYYDGQIVTEDTRYLREVVFLKGVQGLSESELYYFYSAGVEDSMFVASAEYNYNEYGYLTEVEDCNSDYKIKYGITGPWGCVKYISSIEEYGANSLGQKTTYSVGRYDTVVRSSGNNDVYGDSDDIETHYNFDIEGRVSSIYSKSVSSSQIYGASISAYQEQDNVKNQIKHKATVGQTTANYILNGDFSRLLGDSARYWDASENVSLITDSYQKTYMRFSPVANTSDQIKQNIFLENGTYTLSMMVKSYSCAGISAKVKIQSNSNDLLHEEAIPLIKTGASEETFATTFNIEDAANGGKNVDVIIEIVADSMFENGTGAVDVGFVMLGKTVGAANFNYVNLGSFDNIDTSEVYLLEAPVRYLDESQYWTSFEHFCGNDFCSATDDDHDCESKKINISVVTFNGTQQLKIKGEINSNEYISQRIYEASENLIAQYGYILNNDFEYIVSGFVSAYNGVRNERAKTGLQIDVHYYQGENKADVVISHLLEVKSNGESYISGLFDTQYTPDILDTNDYSFVKAIDIKCVYSNQPNNSYAYFDEISVVENKISNVEKYSYDEAGLLISKINNGYEEYYTYDDNGNIVRASNNFGEYCDYVYSDTGGNVLSETNYVINDSYNAEANIQTTYLYNSYGQITASSTFEVNSDLTPKEDGEVISQEFYYDEVSGSKTFGALLRKVDEYGVETKYYYNDQNGDLIAEVNTSSGIGISYTYDDYGNVKKISPITCLDNGEYYIDDYETEVNFNYNSKSELTAISTETNGYILILNEFGQISEIWDYNDCRVYMYEYNPQNGKINKIIYDDGFEISYVYNYLEKVCEVWYNNVKAYEYEYTSFGEIYKIKNLISSKTSIYSYDDNQRLIGYSEYGENNYKDLVFSFTYNHSNLLSSISYKLNYEINGVGTYEEFMYNYLYNSDGNYKQVLVNSNAVDFIIDYTYDSFSRLQGYAFVHYSNDVPIFEQEAAYTYDAGRVVSHNIKTNGAETSKYEYTYDANGNITKIRYKNVFEIRYVYDSAGQLIREDNGFMGETYTYSYSISGNIIRKAAYELTSEEEITTYQRDVQLYQYETNDSQNMDKLLVYDENQNIQYDTIGRPYRYYNGDSYSFYWTNDYNVQISMLNNVLSYVYDDSGNIISKTKNNTKTEYYWSDNLLIGEKTNNVIIMYIYDADDNILGFQYKEGANDWQIYWYETNLFGDVVAIYSESGTKLVTYNYNAWGYFTWIYHNGGSNLSAIVNNPIRYRGYYYDTDLKLYIVNYNFYDFKTCRFLKANWDIIQDEEKAFLNYNLYSYMANNPIGKGIQNKESLRAFAEESIEVEYDKMLETSRAYDLNVGAAEPYRQTSSGNCYGYALGIYEWMHPGILVGFSNDTSCAYYRICGICNDMKALGWSIRKIEGPYAYVSENEYRIAFRMGYGPSEADLKDFHFMVQTYTGQWAEKNGPYPSVLHMHGVTPDHLPWTNGFDSTINYGENIYYFAISKNPENLNEEGCICTQNGKVCEGCS